MKKKHVALSLLGLILGGGIILGIFWWTSWRFFEHTDDAYVHADVTLISAKVSGHVTLLSVSDNQRVRAGDVLLQLDDRDYRVRVDAAQASLEAARAAVDILDARYEQQQNIIDQASAQLAAATAEQTRANKDLARSRSLVATNAASRQELDTRQADLDKALAQQASAEAQLAEARHQRIILRAEQAQAQAAVQQAQASLEAAQLDLEHTRITAPIDGLIGNRAARPGQYVRQGAALMALVPTDRVWIDANFKETQIGSMRPGQRASITIDSFPGQSIEGVIDSLSPASGATFSLLPPENATGNFTKVVQRLPVKIVPVPGNALEGKLRPGMSAIVSIDTRTGP